MAIKLTEMQREYIRKMLALDSSLNTADIIETLSKMATNGSRTNYLKKTYTSMLEGDIKTRSQASSIQPFALDVLDSRRLDQMSTQQTPSPVAQPAPPKPSPAIPLKPRELTVSEIISVENTCLEFMLQNPDTDPSSIDLSVYQSIDSKGFNLIFNHVKMIHRLISLDARLNMTTCKACNLPFSTSRNEKIFLVADNLRKAGNNEFRSYHETCFLEKKKASSLESMLAPRLVKTPVPNDIESLKEKLETVSKLIPTEIAQHDNIFEITVYTKDFAYEILVFDAPNGKLYLDEQEVAFLEDLAVL